MHAVKLGNIAVLCLTGSGFIACYLQLNTNCHPSLWSLEAVSLSLAQQVCCIFSRPYADCRQLIKKAGQHPDSPWVSITASISLTFSSSQILPALSQPFSNLSYVIRPSNWPYTCLKAVYLHLYPIVLFWVCHEVYCVGVICSSLGRPNSSEDWLTRWQGSDRNLTQQDILSSGVTSETFV